MRFLKRAIRRFIEACGYDIFPVPKILKAHPEFRANVDILELFLHDYFDGPPIKFIQIGAADGQENDPVHRFVKEHGWRGVLVEPLPKNFARLQKTYAGVDCVHLVNAAIAPKPGTLKLYYLDRPDLKGSAQLTSFSREHIIKHKHIEFAESEIREIDVPCISVAELVKTHSFEDFDFLQIDTEGMDCKLINTLDFNLLKPKVINFEFIHSPEHEVNATILKLRQAGYQFMVPNTYDLLAFLPKAPKF